MARGVCSTAGPTCCGDDTGRAGQSQRGLHGQRRTGVARRPSMAQRASALGLGVVFRMEDLVGGVLHRLSHITAGQVAGQQGEEAAQPVLGVWGGIAENPAQFRFRPGVPGILRFALVLGS